MNKPLFFFFFLVVAFFAFFAAPLHRGRFYIHGEGTTSVNVELVVEELKRAELLLSGIFNYLPQENFDIIILEGVWEMKATFGLGPWIGAYYKDFKSYLQPVEVLKKREMLERIVFIEYAHYFFDSYTANMCPAWFNELCSVYFCSLYLKSVFPTQCDYTYSDFQEFSNLEKNMRDSERLQAFYYYALRLSYFLLTKYNTNPFSHLINAIHEGKTLEQSMLQRTGKTMQIVFEEEFLPWLKSE